MGIDGSLLSRSRVNFGGLQILTVLGNEDYCSTVNPLVGPDLRSGGRRYLDGAFVDNVPVRALPRSARATGSRIVCLVSDTDPVPAEPITLDGGARIFYLAAARELPLKLWDYSSAERVLETIERGREEGQANRARVREFLMS